MLLLGRVTVLVQWWGEYEDWDGVDERDDAEDGGEYDPLFDDEDGDGEDDGDVDYSDASDAEMSDD